MKSEIKRRRRRREEGGRRPDLDAVLEAVELPARVADLDAGLPDVDRDAFPHLPPQVASSNSGRSLRIKRTSRRDREAEASEGGAAPIDRSGVAGVCEDAGVR
jgi:hypothetical protein